LPGLLAAGLPGLRGLDQVGRDARDLRRAHGGSVTKDDLLCVECRERFEQWRKPEEDEPILCQRCRWSGLLAEGERLLEAAVERGRPVGSIEWKRWNVWLLERGVELFTRLVHLERVGSLEWNAKVEDLEREQARLTGLVLDAANWIEAQARETGALPPGWVGALRQARRTEQAERDQDAQRE
jgi:hypothetical protein